MPILYIAVYHTHNIIAEYSNAEYFVTMHYAHAKNAKLMIDQNAVMEYKKWENKDTYTCYHCLSIGDGMTYICVATMNIREHTALACINSVKVGIEPYLVSGLVKDGYYGEVSKMMRDISTYYSDPDVNENYLQIPYERDRSRTYHKTYYLSRALLFIRVACAGTLCIAIIRKFSGK